MNVVIANTDEFFPEADWSTVSMVGASADAVITALKKGFKDIDHFEWGEFVPDNTGITVGYIEFFKTDEPSVKIRHTLEVWKVAE